MKINFEKVGFRYRKLISNIYNEALKQTKNEFSGLEVTISFVNADEIKALNCQHRNVDKATDVLSFPMLDIIYPQTIKEFNDERLPDGSLYLGDVVICKEVAKRQAREYGHSLKREVAFLALHGFLHVLGYDHIDKEDEKIMMAKSEEILSSMKIKRGKNV